MNGKKVKQLKRLIAEAHPCTRYCEQCGDCLDCYGEDACEHSEDGKHS